MNTSKSARPKSVTPHWVGLDVSKQTFDAGLLLDGGLGTCPAPAQLPTESFPRTREGVECFLHWLDARLVDAEEAAPVRAVMETTGRYSTELAVWLMERRPGLAPAIEHAKRTADFIKSLGVRNTTDNLAARCLAIYGLHRQPEAYEPASPEERQLREVSRYRDVLVDGRTALKNQASEVTENAFAVNNRAKRIRLLDGDIERTENEMRRLINSVPEIKRDVELFVTVYGVGFITAGTVRAELGDLTRFDKARQISANVGLNPSERRSGTSVRGKTHMNKQGNPRVRQALYMAAMVTIQGNNDFQRTYDRLCQRGLKPIAALGAVMRKLLIVMRAISISGQPYDPHWKLRGKTCGKQLQASVQT